MECLWKKVMVAWHDTINYWSLCDNKFYNGHFSSVGASSPVHTPARHGMLRLLPLFRPIWADCELNYEVFTWSKQNFTHFKPCAQCTLLTHYLLPRHLLSCQWFSLLQGFSRIPRQEKKSQHGHNSCCGVAHTSVMLNSYCMLSIWLWSSLILSFSTLVNKESLKYWDRQTN